MIDREQTLLEQCQMWHEQDAFQDIIHAIESLPDDRLTPKLKSELARAYNNIAQVDELRYYIKAIALLEECRQDLQHTYTWNFRMGYAWFYLGYYTVSRCYFKQGLVICPGDEDAEKFISLCEECACDIHIVPSLGMRLREAIIYLTKELIEISSTENQKSSRMRRQIKAVKEAWRCYCSVADVIQREGEKIISFSGGKNRASLFLVNEMVKLILPLLPNGWRAEVAPDTSNIKPGIMIGGTFSVATEALQFWYTQTVDDRVDIYVYGEDLIPLLETYQVELTREINRLVRRALTETTYLQIVSSLTILREPKVEKSVLLSELRTYLRNDGLPVDIGLDDFLRNGIYYHFTPTSNQYLRDKAENGYTCLPELIQEYITGKSDIYHEYHDRGALIGYFSVGFRDPSKGNIRHAIEKLRNEMTRSIYQSDLCCIGYAQGTDVGFVDVVLWENIDMIYEKLEPFISAHPEWHVFFNGFYRGSTDWRISSPAERMIM